ncbi:hypothetical protein CIHG_00200 [Coccidioides immitis H538.4]|uniref:Uncharacterized protein n=2 Tax=Coccidioides immitis TaxID=5501 RepID=A0A0J8U5X9_COCIT|nr:hypothetical protein CIRG_07019 [Coccidioides immitis RMSCC 2394]KMU82418.1 hypothetical protein CIHG_00200 [Coccidioides immitis H538.4]
MCPSPLAFPLYNLDLEALPGAPWGGGRGARRNDKLPAPNYMHRPPPSSHGAPCSDSNDIKALLKSKPDHSPRSTEHGTLIIRRALQKHRGQTPLTGIPAF